MTEKNKSTGNTGARFKVWLLASRPKTLWAAVSPVLIGTAFAYADKTWHAPAALAALVAALFIQIGTNFANDYFDFTKGADSGDRIGPLRATQAGLIPPAQMRNAFLVVFALAMVIGLYLVWRGGWIIVLIGSISILLGILYTATPYALAYTGLADLFVLIFFGPVAVGGTYYVQSLTITPAVLLAGLAPGLISTALLTVNNLRDIKQDRAAGRKTLAVRFGATFAKFEYAVALTLACAIPLLLARLLQAKHQTILATGTILLALPAIKTVFAYRDAAVLNAVLTSTGRFLLIFSLVFSVTLIL